ncbi:MAG: ABC transporter permease [Chthoniobacterales bacterium]|nr:ABC transporter permease [Chthoniobacterales bacterium]
MIQDLKFAIRQLVKAPAFTIAAVTVLALGIGANSAVFSLVNAMLFQPKPFAEPEQVVQLYSQDKKNPKSFRLFSYPTFQDIRQQNTVLTDVMAHGAAIVGVGEKGNTRRTIASVVSWNYFSVLGVAPVHGRAFLPEEETLGKPAHVVIVSDGYWRKQGRDAAVVGSELLINGRPFTVVGIMPEGFTGTSHIIGPEVWLPLSVHDDVRNDFQRSGARVPLSERGGQGRLTVVGRLKPGLTAAAADPQLKTLAANLEQAYPVEQKDQTFMAAPLPRFAGNDPQGDKELNTTGALLLGMAALVLLVACLNLANMLLARGAARRKEIAVRLAVGARRGRIVRQLLTEGFVLALLGGGFGVLLALWSSDLLVAWLGRMVPVDIVVMTGPSAALLAATFGFCLLATLFFGLGPALKLSRATALDDLKEHAGEDVSRRRWKFLPRNPLVVVQIGFSLALITTAALFIRGARTAANIDTGLNTERLFLVEVDASLRGYDRAHTQQLYRTLGEKLAAVPGVENASIAATVPFGMFGSGKRVQRAGSPPPADGESSTAAEDVGFSGYRSVGADYFKTTGLPLLRGRTFTAAEATQPGGPAVAIIDDKLAQKLWPEGDALGQRVQFAAERAATADSGERSGAGKSDEADGQIRPGESIEVVGVVRRTRNAFIGGELGNDIYVPFSRGFQSNVYFLAKFSSLPEGSEASAADLLRRSVMSVDAELPIIGIKTFQQHLDGNLQLWAINAAAALFSAFGMLALGLAVVGLYGVRAYSVARRTREIGIRMALGARRSAVQNMILREGAAMLAAGLVLGLLLASVTGKLLSSMLYEVSALDPVAFTVAPLVLLAVGLLATWLPARRATRISPTVALRTE